MWVPGNDEEGYDSYQWQLHLVMTAGRPWNNQPCLQQPLTIASVNQQLAMTCHDLNHRKNHHFFRQPIIKSSPLAITIDQPPFVPLQSSQGRGFEDPMRVETTGMKLLEWNHFESSQLKLFFIPQVETILHSSSFQSGNKLSVCSFLHFRIPGIPVAMPGSNLALAMASCWQRLVPEFLEPGDNLLCEKHGWWVCW